MDENRPLGPDQEMISHIYKAIMDWSGDGFLVIDENGKIIDINQTYVLKLEGTNGLKREDIIGMNVLDYIPTSLLPDFIHVNKPIHDVDVQQKIADKFLNNTKEQYLISTRATIYSPKRGVLGAVAQVKFYDQVIRLNNQLKQVKQELDYYKNELIHVSKSSQKTPNDSLTSIVGTSDAITLTKGEIVKVASMDFSVLVLGETGTGKELVAAAIHNASSRKNGPFIKLNCSAIPAELFESELFGYEAGAFTGALKKGKKGKLEQANGGTIFLDEIGDMPMSMQAKLLRVLQEREVDVVGGSKPKPIDVRIISATNKDLQTCIKNKTFRSDLYFRLNVICIHVPALRERKGDIPLLAEYLLNRLNTQYQTNTRFGNMVLDLLEDYGWPGNVRELINVVERMYAYAEAGIIETIHVPFLLQHGTHNRHFSKGTLNEQMDHVERSILLTALEANQYNCKRTADFLGIHRSTLYKKMDHHGISRLASDL